MAKLQREYQTKVATREYDIAKAQARLYSDLKQIDERERLRALRNVAGGSGTGTAMLNKIHDDIKGGFGLPDRYADDPWYRHKANLAEGFDTDEPVRTVMELIDAGIKERNRRIDAENTRLDMERTRLGVSVDAAIARTSANIQRNEQKYQEALIKLDSVEESLHEAGKRGTIASILFGPKVKDDEKVDIIDPDTGKPATFTYGRLKKLYKRNQSIIESYEKELRYLNSLYDKRTKESGADAAAGPGLASPSGATVGGELMKMQDIFNSFGR